MNTKEVDKSIAKSDKYKDFQDSQLEEIYKDIKKTKTLDGIQESLIIAIEAIKRIYNYKTTEADIEKLNLFLNNVSINISNGDTFYAFLLFSTIMDLQNQQLHALFVDDFLARKYFLQSKTFFETLNIKSTFNFTDETNIAKKSDIFSSSIIFSDWKRIIWEHVNNLNVEKVTNKINLKFNCAFIFDMDRIVYDYEKLTLKFDTNDLNPNRISVKKYFQLYEKMVGVSPCLFFESKQIEKSYKIKISKTQKNKEITKAIKNAEEIFYQARIDKIKSLAQEIKLLNDKKETVIIDIYQKEDYELLYKYLTSDNIPFSTIDSTVNITNKNILTILTPNKITLVKDLLNTSIESKLGGDYKEIANTNALNKTTDINSNYYNETLKKELNIQKEIHERNKEILLKNGGINLIFASHYTELKLEYAIINNYHSTTPIKCLKFYNCSEDEIYKEFGFNKLSIFNKENNSENKILFKIFSNFMFYYKNFAVNKLIKQKDDCLIFEIIKNT